MELLELLESDGWDEALLQHAVRAEQKRRAGANPPGERQRATAPHTHTSVQRAHAAVASGPATLHADMQQQLDAVHMLFGRWEQEAEAHRAVARRARLFSSPAKLQAALVVFNARGQRTSRQGKIVLQDFFFAPRRRPSRLEAVPCHRCYVAIQRQQLYFVDVAKPPRQARCPSAAASAAAAPPHPGGLPEAAPISCPNPFLLPAQADEVCEPCMTVLLRQALGENDAVIMEGGCIGGCAGGRWCCGFRPRHLCHSPQRTPQAETQLLTPLSLSPRLLALLFAEAAALLERAWTPRIDVALADALLPRRTYFS